MGLDSLSSFVKHSLTLRAVTQMAGEQYLPAGEEGHFDFIDEPMLFAKFPHPLNCILECVLINIVGM